MMLFEGESFVCCLCGKQIEGEFGNDPHPIRPSSERCNNTRVVPARSALSGDSPEDEQRLINQLEKRRQAREERQRQGLSEPSTEEMEGVEVLDVGDEERQRLVSWETAAEELDDEPNAEGEK